MEQYIQYIQEKDQKLIFHPEYEMQVIETVLGNTEGYNQLKEDNGDELPPLVEWVTHEDLELAKFSFQMFIRSKKIMLTDITQEEFLILWDNYTMTPDYFIQITNYMLNSDDYTSGARIKLQSEDTKPTEFPDSHLGQNMKNLQASFHGNPLEESRFVQKIAGIGTDVFKIFHP